MDEKFLIGIKVIDEQHRQLFQIANKLNGEVLDYALLSEIFIELIKYSEYHFKTEEIFWEKLNFEESIIHKKMHEKFIEELNNKILGLKIENSLSNQKEELNLFIKNWLYDHILKEDVKLKELK